MKVYKFCLIAFLTLLLFSCKKETENMSRTLTYVAFEILGDNPVIMEPSAKYEDAGAIATLQGKDVTSGMTVKMNVVSDAMGLYKVEYSHKNSEGYVSRAVREVIVCNPNVTADLTGTWDVIEDDTYRLVLSTGAQVFYGGDGFTVKITRLAPGFFDVSDFLAGWYSIRTYPQYYPLSAMIGYFSMDEDNNIEEISSFIGLWEDGLDFLRNGIYDPDSDPDVEIIKWEVGYAGSMEFFITLTKSK